MNYPRFHKKNDFTEKTEFYMAEMFSELFVISSKYTLFYFCCVIMYLRDPGNSRGVLQGHAEEVEYGGGGEGTRGMEMEGE